MEAGTLFVHVPLKLQRSSRCRLPSFPRFIRASFNLQGVYKGPKPKRQLVADWVSSNDDFVRTLPIYVGGVSLLAVLFNRTLSGIAPVADARSSQSRADLLTLGLAVSNILTGLVWLSIRPKSISVVNPQGVECQRIYTDLPDVVVSEIMWVWESMSVVTCCRSLVIVYDSRCILQIGFAGASSSSEGEVVVVDASKLMQGSLYQGVLKSGSRKQHTMFFELLCILSEYNKVPAQDLSLKRKNQYLPVLSESYLANLSLYPGKSELSFLPSNTQAVILQPLGDKGIAIIGGNTIRGFTTSDQAWITLIGEKLDATLTKHVSNLSLAMQDRS